MTARSMGDRLRRMENSWGAQRARVSSVPYGEPDDGQPEHPLTEEEWLERVRQRDTSAVAPANYEEEA